MKILLIGDYCTDCFIMGDVSRLAPEAPVAVLVPTDCVTNPGMGGNVLANLKSLAPQAEITALLPPIVNMKMRYVDKRTGHHFLRVDEPDACEPVSFQIAYNTLLQTQFDALVISDYCKGYLTTDTMGSMIAYCVSQGIPVFLDTKRILGKWSGGSFGSGAIVKINDVEFLANKEALGRVTNYCHRLIVTGGNNGMTLLFPDDTPCIHSPAVGQVEVKDGAGCGDSVLAALVVRYLENGRDLKDAMDWANKVGAIAVSKRGVVAVKREEVK